MEDKIDRTTATQMKEASVGAVYVWCNSDLGYPKAMAQWLCRGDITIISPHDLETAFLRAKNATEIVIDHAAELTDDQIRGIQRFETRIRIGNHA